MLVREQFFMLLLNPGGSVGGHSEALYRKTPMKEGPRFAAIREVLSASAELSGEVARSV